MTANDDLTIDDNLIRQLLERHTPQWSHLAIGRVNSSGTDNALYRIGDELVLRIPRREAAAPLMSKELDWLSHLNDLPLATPTLRYRGRVNIGFECEFGILDWMTGDLAIPENIENSDDAAVSLAGFLNALHQKPVINAPVAGSTNHFRGVPLNEMSERTFAAIEIVSDEIDAKSAVELWKEALNAPRNSSPVWLHGDLKADNLLTRNGRLSGVIDWGLSAVGDPAADFACAWSWLQPPSRERFKNCLNLDEAAWLRGKAWALYGAVIALSFYRGGKNKPLCEQSRLTLSRLDLLM